MNWIPLTDSDQLDQLIQASHEKAIIIFKHSTTCPISSIAKLRLEGKWSIPEDKIAFYFLDLLKYRSLSNLISEKLQVHHESPQIIVLKDGEVNYDNSHLDISISDTEGVLV